MGRKNIRALQSGQRNYDRHAPLPDVVCPCGAAVSRADLSAARRAFGTPTTICSDCRRSGSVAYSGPLVEVVTG